MSQASVKLARVPSPTPPKDRWNMKHEARVGLVTRQLSGFAGRGGVFVAPGYARERTHPQPHHLLDAHQCVRARGGPLEGVPDPG